MLHDINAWRCQIGLYHASFKCLSKTNTKENNSSVSIIIDTILMFFILLIFTCFLEISYSYISLLVYFKVNFIIFDFFFITVKDLYLAILLLKCGDIEQNPGPRQEYNLSIMHWNVNSIPSHNFIKLSMLEAFTSIHKFDLICVSESFLDSSYSSNDPSLTLKGYKLARSDHPLDIKRGGSCVFYRESLPIKFLSISNLSECLICEILYNNKKCTIVSLYRSPSQSNDEFEFFMKEFEVILENISNPGNPNLIIIVGDFNARLSSWKTDDPDTHEGIEIDSLTSSYGLTQIISSPTHILPNSSSCIDLFFTNQPNIVINSGVYSSLHPNCHHQIIYANINFKLFFPPPYQRQIWHYSRANVEAIQLCLNNIDWDREFLHRSIDEQVVLFNTYLLNICQNYIPNEVITINDRDQPWITPTIKLQITKKNMLYTKYIQNGRKIADFHTLEATRNTLKYLIQESKKKYYNRLSGKLSDPKTSSKAYWSILKSFFIDKKLPVIPPLLVNNEFVTDFKVKSNLFNDHFAKQCSLLNNTSTLPNEYPPLPLYSISDIQLNDDEILKLIRNLDVNKSHGHDGISSRILRLCDSSIVKPLKLIFTNSLTNSTFPSSWKKANIIPIHKKDEKNNLKNYRPISVLPTCGKLFEKLIYNSLYHYLEHNKILNLNQSGFRSGDSCINQLISITHNIFKSFDANPSLEVRGVFLDISKAFDKVWHEGVLFKLRSIGVEGKLFDFIKDFLKNRSQRVVLNGQCSSWENIAAGVPQGSILGPLLFLIYINDITDGLETDVKLFADDTSIFSIVTDVNQSARLINSDLSKIEQWAFQWKMSFNPDPSKQAQEVIFSKKNTQPPHPDLMFNQAKVKRVPSQKHLGVILDAKLNFNEHLKIMINKLTKGISMLRKLRYYIPRHSLITIYKSFIRSHTDFADVIYDQPHNNTIINKLESIQYNSALAITGAIRGTSREKLYQELGLEYLSSRRWFKRLSLFHKIIYSKSPYYLHNIIPKPNHLINTRYQYLIPNFFCRTLSFTNSFFPYSIKEWNKLDRSLTSNNSLSSFRNTLLKSIRPTPNRVYGACDPHGLILLTRLRVGLSHLREHKFKHGFNDTINPLCPCNMEVESTTHFYLHCQNFVTQRLDLMNEIFTLEPNLQNLDEKSLTNVLLFGSKEFGSELNTKILNLSIAFILCTKRFEEPLF